MVYVLAIAASFLPNHPTKIAFAALLLMFYAFYVYQTLTGEGSSGEIPERLYLERAVRYPNEASLAHPQPCPVLRCPWRS